MAGVTLGIGALLVLVGVVAYGSTGMESATALAPAAVGVILVVLGALAVREVRPAAMIHAALVVSVLGVVASLMPLMDLPAMLRGDDVERPTAVVASALLAALCLVHVALGVRSFARARQS